MAGAMLGALALALIPPPELQPARPRVLFMDVGQGDAALLQGSQGTILVDAGAADRGETVVLRALAAAGVRSVDLAVLTHADLDHRGGLTSVLGGIAVERLWLPRGAGTDPALLPLLEAARARGALVEERGAGDPPARIGDLLVTPLWPPAAGAGARNDRSLVVRVDTKESSVLFPGDIEARGERALLDAGVDLRADVLALPHHGSRSSSSTAFLTAVAPEVAVASAPCLGRFAMPAPEVAALLSERAATLWWTGRDGAVGVGLGRPRVVRGWRSAPLGFCR